MSVESFRGYVVATTAAAIVIGTVILGWLAWNAEYEEPKDLAIIFGFLTGAFTLAANHLFTNESNTQAQRATERAIAIQPNQPTEPTP